MERTADLEERFQALEDELNLVKSEIKQVLVDLREFMLNYQTVLPQARQEVRLGTPPRAPVTDRAREDLSPPAPLPWGLPAPSTTDARNQGSHPPLLQSGPHPSADLDPAMLGNVIWWMGTVKRRGLSLQQIAPFLETYEMSGHLTPTMAKLILRSMAQMDEQQGESSAGGFSPQNYTECLIQLHDILCTPGYRIDRLVPPSPEQ